MRNRRLLTLISVAILGLGGAVAVATTSSAAGGIHVEYKTTMTGASAYEMEPWFDVVNGSSAPVALSSLTLRYYFTVDTTGSYRFACAWAHVGCANLTGTVVAMSPTTSTADHYLQITFGGGAGTLAPGADTQDMQLRLYRADWQNVNQANDYSFNASMTTYTDNSDVTAYQNGALAWGVPPAGGGGGSPSPSSSPSPSPSQTGGNPPPAGQVMFDDFSYASSSDTNLSAHGWSVRTSSGGPGVAGATWSASAVTFPSDPTLPGNKVMQLESSDTGPGGNTVQTEVDTTAQKFFTGTYAARVYFNDAPPSGPDGDSVNETFYTITPLAYDNDPLYSELDFEYLPNGGWGDTGPKMYTTSWYTYQNNPTWVGDRVSSNVSESLQGWHTLLMTVNGGTVTYYIDGTQVFSSTGKYYPRQDMTIDFNNWFIDGELASGSTPRHYDEQVDWVYYNSGANMTTADVTAQVNTYRSAHTTYTDNVS